MNNLEPSKTLEEIDCDKCESKLPTVQNLRMHMRINHMSHCQTQQLMSIMMLKLNKLVKQYLKNRMF